MQSIARRRRSIVPAAKVRRSGAAHRAGEEEHRRIARLNTPSGQHRPLAHPRALPYMALLRMAIVVSALLAGAAASGGGAAAPANLGVNGLTESTGLDSASFPVDESFVLT